jgi:hypothetical protein
MPWICGVTKLGITTTVKQMAVGANNSEDHTITQADDLFSNTPHCGNSGLAGLLFQ